MTALGSTCADYVFYVRSFLELAYPKLKAELARRGSRLAKLQRECVAGDPFATKTVMRDEHSDRCEMWAEAGTIGVAALIDRIAADWEFGPWSGIFEERAGKMSSNADRATFVRTAIAELVPTRLAAHDATMALVTSCAAGKLPAVKSVLAAVEDVDFVLGPYLGSKLAWQSPMTLAVTGKHAKIVDLLATHGADVNIQYRADNMSTATPISTAATLGDLGMVKRLLALGADPTRGSDDGGPLHQAVAHGHLPIVKQLIERVKLDVDARNTYGRTPLMECGNDLASVPEAKRLAIARYLVSKGASTRLENIDGMTARAFAEEYKRTKLAAYLAAV